MWMDALRIAPLIVFLIIGGQLSIIDYRIHRLPNRLVAVCTAGILSLQLGYCLALGSISPFWVALPAALKMFVAYAFLYLLSRGQLGMGDVKFAIPVGLIVGWHYQDAWIVSLLATFLLAGLFGLLGLAFGKFGRHSHIALGPFMYISAIGTVLFAF